jgi:hypothetical protein
VARPPADYALPITDHTRIFSDRGIYRIHFSLEDEARDARLMARSGRDAAIRQLLLYQMSNARGICCGKAGFVARRGSASIRLIPIA